MSDRLFGPHGIGYGCSASVTGSGDGRLTCWTWRRELCPIDYLDPTPCGPWSNTSPSSIAASTKRPSSRFSKPNSSLRKTVPPFRRLDAVIGVKGREDSPRCERLASKKANDTCSCRAGVSCPMGTYEDFRSTVARPENASVRVSQDAAR